jgi:hypothetical protein
MLQFNSFTLDDALIKGMHVLIANVILVTNPYYLGKISYKVIGAQAFH